MSASAKSSPEINLWSVTPFEDAHDANSARDLYAAYAALAAKVIATSGTNPDPLEEEPSATQAPMCLGREPGWSPHHAQRGCV